MATEDRRAAARYPVVSLGAEYLVMGHLLRRNILTYKAPPNNDGYDLICIHPDPRVVGPQIRVQVKSRLATDCDRGFPVKGRTLDAFDFLIVVFLNVGNFFGKARHHPGRAGRPRRSSIPCPRPSSGNIIAHRRPGRRSTPAASIWASTVMSGVSSRLLKRSTSLILRSRQRRGTSNEAMQRTRCAGP